MRATRSEVFKAIDIERQYQVDKYGLGRKLPVSSWLLIAERELDEAKESFLLHSKADLLSEVIQTAAVLVALLEEYGVVARGDTLRNGGGE